MWRNTFNRLWGGSDVKSNTPGSTVSNSIVGEVGSFRINHLALKGIVDANNTKAFIKTQYALNIVDISNISSPEILNEYNLTLLGYSVALSSDNKLFIDDGRYLKILDATNPKALNQIGEYEASGAFADFVLSKDENTLFAIDGNFLKVIDVSNPTNPYELTSISLPSAHKLHISEDGKKLYVMLQGIKRGLTIVDITNKNNPIKKDEYEIDNSIIGIFNMAISKDDKTAILATSGGLIVLDVSNPNSIQKVTTYKSNSSISVSGVGVNSFSDVIIASNNKTAFAIDAQNIEVTILDINNPENPTKIRGISFTNLNSAPHKIFLSNDETKLFVAIVDNTEIMNNLQETMNNSQEGNINTTIPVKIYIFDVSSYTGE